MFRSLFATALLLFGFSTAFGDHPSSVRDSARVSVVEVPVHVVSRDGNPITGLTAADFEIFEDGRRQTITGFDVVDLSRVGTAAAGSTAISPAATRHFLFLFDFSFATANEIARSRDAALRFVDSGLSPADRVAVATTSAESGPRLKLTFTSDRFQIAAAIRSIGLPNEMERARDPLGFAFTPPGQAPVILQEGEAPKPQQMDAAASQKIHAAMAQKVSDDYTLTRVERHLSDMSALAAALDVVPGRKTIVYFSEGFDGRLLSGTIAHERSLEQTHADNDAMLSGAAWSIDVDRRYANSPLQRQLAETVDRFRRSDCIVYPIDIAGLKGADDADLARGGRGEESLFAFAQGTGGELVGRGNDFLSELKLISRRTGLTYVLAYQSSARNAGDGAFHAINVRTRVRGARVSARAGYYEQRSFRLLSPLQRALSAASVVTHEKGTADFELDVLAVPFAGKTLARVPVVLGIPARAFASAASPSTALEIYVYVSDEKETVTDYFTRRISIEPSVADGARKNGVVFSSSCHLPPGLYRVRAYVRNATDGRFGFRAVPLEVPDLTAAGVYALPPIFLPGSFEGALHLRDSQDAQEPSPFSIGGKGFAPEAIPTLSSSGKAGVCLMLYRPGAPDAALPFQVDLEVFDGEGRAKPAEVALVGRTAPDSDGLIKLLFDFSPSRLPAGVYRLRVTVRDGDARVTSQTEFRIG